MDLENQEELINLARKKIAGMFLSNEEGLTELALYSAFN